MSKGVIKRDLEIKNLPKDWVKVIEKYEKIDRYAWFYNEDIVKLIKYMLSKKITKKNIRLALAELGYRIPEDTFYKRLRESEIFNN